MDNEAIVATTTSQDTSRKLTNLDVGLQSGAGIVRNMTGLVHHLCLLHHEVCMEKGLPGSTRRVV